MEAGSAGEVGVVLGAERPVGNGPLLKVTTETAAYGMPIDAAGRGGEVVRERHRFIREGNVETEERS